MIVVVGEFVQERSRFQDERRKDDPGQVHAGPDLLHQEPDDGFVLVRELFSLINGGTENLMRRIWKDISRSFEHSEILNIAFGF